MKDVVEIKPKPTAWKKVVIFMAGCATGAAGTIGAMLIKERTEVQDGCVIFHRDKKMEDEQDNPAPEAEQHEEQPQSDDKTVPDEGSKSQENSEQ